MLRIVWNGEYPVCTRPPTDLREKSEWVSGEGGVNVHYSFIRLKMKVV